MRSIENSPGSQRNLDDGAPMIDVRGLQVEFASIAADPVVAIRALDISVRRGEIFGLVGESGAGKTTLARSLMRLPPEPGRIVSGEIRFDGNDLLKLDDRALQRIRGRDIAMIVPNPRGELNPLLPVGEQIATVARIHLNVGRKAAREMALNMLRAVQIPDPQRRMKAYPHELSGGMAQRIVIAIALICSAKFIVSDDATSGLDVTVQAQILDLMRDLVLDRQSSMLFITRDIGIAAHLCDRIAVIYNGEILEMADRDGFFFSPRHPYTIMLMAAFSYNQRLRALWSRTVDIRDQPTQASRCQYASRCPLAQARCLSEHPALRELSPGRFARCHFPVER
jgi:oligopeptide/dipeptide ABC transporter ATP-binding protein